MFIVSAVRTPIGSFQGALASVSGPQLGAIAIKKAVELAGILPGDVEEVYMGAVCQAQMGQAPARQALIFAGLPETTEATTVNKVCASGMKSIAFAAQSIMLGHRDIMIAGGMESMSNVPFYLQREVIRLGGTNLKDGIVFDGLTDVYNHCHMGNCAENTNKNMKISREEQDAYCIQSYQRSKAAWDQGIMQKEIVPVEVKGKTGVSMVSEDEEYKKVNVEKIAKLRPVFEKDGTITAGNASKLNDAGCALVVMSEEAIKRTGTKPLARIITFADAATKPIDFPVAPAYAIPKLYEQSGIKQQDVAMFEVNEAFSGVAIANMRLCNLDPAKTNIHGGAVSLGHPLGMSGARLITHLVHNLQPGEKGVGALCNGGGAASAMMIEKL